MGTELEPIEISVDDYLAAELNSQTKSEYLDGMVFPRAETTNAHNEISVNTFGCLHARLRGRRCRPFNSDTRIRLHVAGQVRFYYPDVSVTRDPNPPNSCFQDNPAVLFEVLSQKTRRIDLAEKQDAYLATPSLQVYVVIEQDVPAVVAFRRSETGFVREVYTGLDAVLPLPEIDTELPLAEIYDRVVFIPEPDDDDEA